MTFLFAKLFFACYNGVMLSLFDKTSIQKALMFASVKHKEQKMGRPPVEIPYATHFIGVALTAINYTYNQDIDKTFLLTLALLHDTIEDTNATYQELLTEFGKSVADGVLALSRNESIAYENQIADCVHRIKSQPKEVAIVKMADRMFNMRERYKFWSIEKQDNYKAEGQMICDELGYASQSMKQALQETINAY